MKMLLVFAVVLLAFSEIAEASMKSKCDVVRALKNQNVPDWKIRDWLCLVIHESTYRYDVTHDNSYDGSKDYGIYQLNDKYWCGRGSTKYNLCWQINTYGCGVNDCNDFLDADISDDTECAVKIQRCNEPEGFRMWYGWRDHCKGMDLSTDPNLDFSDC